MKTLQSKKPMKKSDVECGTFVKISEMSILEIEKPNGAQFDFVRSQLN